MISKTIKLILVFFICASFNQMHASAKKAMSGKIFEEPIIIKKAPPAPAPAAPAQPARIRCVASQVVTEHRRHNGGTHLVPFSHNVYCQNFNCKGNHYWGKT